ncbi:retropepsin-like domain-containing protein [Candidatus Bathyarchaeota archaeon]|nr:retropepsin-like domain-containing protein [Candidatus Bathyarchaeota archaeon]
MRIPGYINYGYRPPAPFVAAAILLRQLNTRASLPLLLDTGASNTMILWGDVERLGIHVSKMKPEREFSGLGGLIGAKPTASTISLRSDKGQLVEVHIVTGTCPHPKLKLLPSILGRDIINKYILSYSYDAGKVYLEK